MSVTSGFFNSLNGDRRYNAEQISAIFNGVINDGVFASVGKAFAVNADSGNTITVGVGRGWFNSTWIYNDGLLPLTLDMSDSLLDRYDVIVIEIDRTDNVRAGTIKVIKGSPSGAPYYPILTKSQYKNQYPLAYIHRPASSAEITQANITNAIGTSECPYVTGILQVQNIDNIVAQWMAEWEQWMAEQEVEFDLWFRSIRAVLEGDPAAALADRVLKLEDGTTPVAKATDADTLDGYHADFFIPFNGSREGCNPVSDLNNFYTGVALFHNITNGPGYEWTMVISSGMYGTVAQIAIDLTNYSSAKLRQCAAGNWGTWSDLKTGCLPLSGGTTGPINASKLTLLREDTYAEGGQLEFEYPSNATNKSNRVIDAHSDNLRIFEHTHPFRGAYLNFVECGEAVGSKILHTGISAAVKIQSSSPSDTSALWVW